MIKASGSNKSCPETSVFLTFFCLQKWYKFLIDAAISTTEMIKIPDICSQKIKHEKGI